MIGSSRLSGFVKFEIFVVTAHCNEILNSSNYYSVKFTVIDARVFSLAIMSC